MILEGTLKGRLKEEHLHIFLKFARRLHLRELFEKDGGANWRKYSMKNKRDHKPNNDQS